MRCTFEKTRHFSGEDAEPFLVQLKEIKDGSWQWEVGESVEDKEIQEVADAMNAGMTIEEIGAKIGQTKSQVETKRKKARSRGLTTL